MSRMGLRWDSMAKAEYAEIKYVGCELMQKQDHVGKADLRLLWCEARAAGT